VVELDRARPADLDGRAQARPDVRGVDAAGDTDRRVEAARRDHRLVAGIEVGRAVELPVHLREAALDVVHEVRAPAEALDPEVAPGAEDGVVDPGTVLDRAAQLVGEVARHADAGDLDRPAVDRRMAEAQEGDVSRRSSPVARSRVSNEVGPATWKRYHGEGSISTRKRPSDGSSL
jgi:hypothetical protein